MQMKEKSEKIELPLVWMPRSNWCSIPQISPIYTAPNGLKLFKLPECSLTIIPTLREQIHEFIN